MRWPWTRPKLSAREISDAQEMRLRNAKEAAVRQERERILRGLRALSCWSSDGVLVVDAKEVKNLVESKRAEATARSRPSSGRATFSTKGNPR